MFHDDHHCNVFFSESLANREFSQYLEILQRLLPHLQSSLKNDAIDSSDSEEDMDISDPVSFFVPALACCIASIRVQGSICLSIY